MFSQVLCLSMGDGVRVSLLPGPFLVPGHMSFLEEGYSGTRSPPGPWSFLGVEYLWSPGYPTPRYPTLERDMGPEMP